jgi:hypothetical protein
VGAAIDIGPIMARKVMKENGQVMYRISVRSLTPDEIQSPSEREGMKPLTQSLKRNMDFQ